MTRLEGIIYNFDEYVIFRGFAPMGELAKISEKADSYSMTTESQKTDLVKYLRKQNSYYPDITLSLILSKYDELVNEITNEKIECDLNEESGINISIQKLQTKDDRIRYAYLNIPKTKKLTRIDGNRRLELLENNASNIELWKQYLEKETTKEDCDTAIEKAKKIIVPFSVILSKKVDKDEQKSEEVKIFHDINFRAKPFREEAFLKKISEFKGFKYEQIGEEYPLTIKLIWKIEKNKAFDVIRWLKVEEDVNKSYFRTTCLRIVQLLLKRRDFYSPKSSKNLGELGKLEKKHADRLKKLIQMLEEYNESGQLKQILKKEKEICPHEDLEKYYEKLREQKQELNEVWIKLAELRQNELTRLEQGNYYSKKLKRLIEQQGKLEKIKHKLETVENGLKEVECILNFIENCTKEQQVLLAIGSLIETYQGFNGEYGNIAFLCAATYYSLLDKNMLNLFIVWATLNGINKITTPDDLSNDASLNLITMFDQIQQAKRNEIFISMQFGDSQSELIYEKICRSIDKFNEKHKSIYLRLRPIRIDRTTECSSSVPDDIKKAIQSSGLIIADLSSANINVYQEVGYAMGLAESNNMTPNIILLYKENTEHNKNNKDVDKFIGFNLRSLSQLRFKDYDQLVEGLVKRLEKYYEVSY